MINKGLINRAFSFLKNWNLTIPSKFKIQYLYRCHHQSVIVVLSSDTPYYLAWLLFYWL